MADEPTSNASSGSPAEIKSEDADPPRIVDLDDPALYLNRELTWLKFNERVLHEAEDSRVPVLERVKFLAIAGSNLDEFFMKRIGGLKVQVEAGVKQKTVDDRTPAEQIVECHEFVRRFQTRHEQCARYVLAELESKGVRIVTFLELAEADREALRKHFIDNIFPVVTPLAMDPGHPFPFISNLALNLLVTMRFPGDSELRMARVKVPIGNDVTPRFLRLGQRNLFVPLDDVIANNLDLLFPGMRIESCDRFRVTRNANVERSEETASDLMELIETELQERHFASIVRLEILHGMSSAHRGMLAAELGLDETNDVFDVNDMLAMRDLMEIAGLEISELRDPPHVPLDHARLAHDPRSIFHVIRDGGPMLLQHPYESFGTSVERFLRAAADDPKVLAIKMTLYRTSGKGRVIDSLVRAARNGKQVAVLVELKARFDEAANIRWARRFEQAGIHVTYGVVGLKTHSKIILVVRKDYDGLARYAHIGTGNYHEGTARMYTDLGLLTRNPEIGQDLTELFNYLTGYSPPPSYRKILAAPHTLKRGLLSKIDREITHHLDGKPAHIQIKMNALEDVDVTRALYRATQAGVKVDLIIRDTCRFRPGISGLSESARVISIVGRFLEHCRIVYFKNGDQEEYYIGSADMMKRNLESRVEVLAPVEDKDLRQDLRLILDVQLADQRSAWDMCADGTYLKRPHLEGKESRNCQEVLIGLASTRLAAAAKHKQKHVRRKLFDRFKQRGEAGET